MGIDPLVTLGTPVIQGAASDGKQGMGVSTPSAAAVAAATTGFAGHWHMPKVGTFTKGLLLTVFPKGSDEAEFVEMTFSIVGVIPNEQLKSAVLVTADGIGGSLY